MGYPNMSKSRIYLLSPSRENTIVFCIIYAILGRKHGGVTSQRVRIKIWHILFHLHSSWSNSCKQKFASNTFEFCGYRSQRIFRFGWFHPRPQLKIFQNCSGDEVGLLFLVPHLHFWNKWVRNPDKKFNAEPIGTNFKSQNEKPKSSCAFSNFFFYFETNLIKGFP